MHYRLGWLFLGMIAAIALVLLPMSADAQGVRRTQTPAPGGRATRAFPSPTRSPAAPTQGVPRPTRTFAGPSGTPTFGAPRRTVTPRPSRTPNPLDIQGTATQLASSVLPFPLDSANLTKAAPQSSDEAYAALTTFASDNLGLSISPFYAGNIPNSASQQVPAGTADEIIAQFPADVQAILAQVQDLNGIGYWGVFNEGAAIVYVGDCTNNPTCTVSTASMQIQLSAASLGAYAIYLPSDAPTDANDAVALIGASYPALAGVQLIPVDVQTGFAFTGTTTDLGRDNSVIKVVYAGVVSHNGQAVVYAVVGVGESYAQMVRR